MEGSADREIILARVGNKNFALPLEDVEHILALSCEDARHADTTGVIAYHGDPLPWHPLWPAMGEKSCFADLDDMLVALPQRRQDHIDWMAALELSLVGGTPFTKARSPHECAFGQWFYAYRTDNRKLRLLLDQFESPHHRIHGLADLLLGLKDAGRIDEAMARLGQERETTLAVLLDLFDKVIAMAPTLKRQQALIVGGDGGRHALGVDGVLDIHALEAGRYRPAAGGFGPLKPEGFVVGAAGEMIPLLRARALMAL